MAIKGAISGQDSDYKELTDLRCHTLCLFKCDMAFLVHMYAKLVVLGQ